MELKTGIIYRTFLLMTLALGLVNFVSSCADSPDQLNSTRSTINMMDDTLINYNKKLVKTESQEIEDFIKRYNWKMQTSSTGLRYMVYKKGQGAFARKGDLVSIKYTVHLLNGDRIFKSDSTIPFQFEIGKCKVTSGLEEGVMLTRTGGKAKLVVPSHLAFGLIGDQDRIPERAILVYDIEICQINHSN